MSVQYLLHLLQSSNSCVTRRGNALTNDRPTSVAVLTYLKDKLQLSGPFGKREFTKRKQSELLGKVGTSKRAVFCLHMLIG